MPQERADITLARIARRQYGAFSREQAVRAGLSEKQIQHRIATELWPQVLPKVYRHAGTPPTKDLELTGALLWAGENAVVTGRSGGELWGVSDVEAVKPEIIVPRSLRARSKRVVVHRSDDRAALQVRRIRGFPVTSAAATLLTLASDLSRVELEAAFESARRARIVTIPAMRRYLDTHGRRGVAGTNTLRSIVDALDPVAPSRSTLEVLTGQLLVAFGLSDFVREYKMEWQGRTYYFDFAFPRQKVILETNGRRWHNDASDYEHDHEKWSVPGRYGWRIVFATWDKVAKHPELLLNELYVALAA